MGRPLPSRRARTVGSDGPRLLDLCMRIGNGWSNLRGLHRRARDRQRRTEMLPKILRGLAADLSTAADTLSGAETLSRNDWIGLTIGVSTEIGIPHAFYELLGRYARDWTRLAREEGEEGEGNQNQRNDTTPVPNALLAPLVRAALVRGNAPEWEGNAGNNNNADLQIANDQDVIRVFLEAHTCNCPRNGTGLPSVHEEGCRVAREDNAWGQLLNVAEEFIDAQNEEEEEDAESSEEEEDEEDEEENEEEESDEEEDGENGEQNWQGILEPADQNVEDSQSENDAEEDDDHNDDDGSIEIVYAPRGIIANHDFRNNSHNN